MWLGNGEIRDKVAYMRIGDRVDSDHQPMAVTLKGRGRRGRGKKNKRRIWKVVCVREGRVMVRERLEGWRWRGKNWKWTERRWKIE